MRFAAPELVACWLVAASPALAARKPVLPPLPPLELTAATPMIEVDVAGRRLRLTVDFGGDDIVQINPDSPARAVLAGDARPDGKPPNRGRYRVSVGQTALAIPFSRETLTIAGRPVRARLLTPDVEPPGQPPGSDGTIGLPLLPHDHVTWRWRDARDDDRLVSLPARIGRSDAWGFDWALATGGSLDVEIHPLRPFSVASAAAASQLAAAGNGRLVGSARRVMISFGAVRPVRILTLAPSVPVAGLPVQQINVRLYDWAGRSDLPPDAVPDDALPVVGRRGRQSEWTNVKLGNDLLGRCASLIWTRLPATLALACPARP